MLKRSFRTLLLVAIALHAIAFGNSRHLKPGEISINGVVLSLPQRFARVAAPGPENTAFFYDRKYKEGLVIVVPGGPSSERDVMAELINRSLQTFFPKETTPFQWKSETGFQKVSRFEVSSLLSKGFNQNILLLFEGRHVVVDKKELFVATIYQARQGKPAQEMFNGEGAAMSMTTCQAAAEVVFSFTKEKVNPEKPPCELIANVPE
jgi:hypothetical protein